MVDLEIKKLIEEQGQLFVNFRTEVNKELEQLRTKGAVDPDLTVKIAAMNARFDEIEVKMNRPRVIVPGAGDDSIEQKSNAYIATEKVFRYGLKGGAALEHMSTEERKSWQELRAKSLNAGTDAAGGVFVPEDYQAQVIKKIANIAGVGALVSRQATSRDVVRWPKLPYSTDDLDTSGLSVTWEDNETAVTTTDPTPFSSLSINVHKARGLILLDRELLEDQAIDVMALLSSLISDKVNVEIDRVVTSGASGKKPVGFMTNTGVGTTNSGSSGAFTFDGLMDLIAAVPEQYVGNAIFMMKRASLFAVRKLKDSQNRPLWEPSQQAGMPTTLLGYPVRTNEHIAAIAAAARAAILADFKRLYMIVDKVGLSVQRLDEKYADTDQIGFIFRLRMGGDVIAPWAGRIQVLS